jgi:YfiH family protein
MLSAFPCVPLPASIALRVESNQMRPSTSPSSATGRDLKSPDLREIDALFQEAGLVRNLRGNSGAISHKQTDRLDRADAEELRRPAPPARVARNGVQWLAVPGWEKMSAKVPWLWHGYSTRKGGVSRAYCADDAPGELNLGFTPGDSREAVLRNRSLLAEAVSGDAGTPLVAVKQFHSNVVHRATAADAARELPWRADGLITGEPGLLLGIQTADCIPVLVADRKRRVVGAFHAGWRGTVKRIVETGVGCMRLEYGCRPEDMVAAIGPGVGACCYAVGEEVLSEFESQFPYARELFHEVYSKDAVRNKYPMLFLTQRAPGHSPIGPSLHLDLVEANRRQLLYAGLKPRAIHVLGGCTSCQTEMFFSHRASQGHAGRMMAVIGIKPSSK